MKLKPHILYWKWNDDLLDEETLRERTMDIIRRSMFNVIYVALHSASAENHITVNPQMRERIRQCADILRAHGRKLVVDLNARGEHIYMQQHPLNEKSYSSRYCAGKLDETGCYTQKVEGADSVFFCKCLTFDENGLFDENSVCDITDQVTVTNGTVSIHAGSQFQNRDVVFYARKTRKGVDSNGNEFLLYDLYGDDYKKEWESVYASLSDLGIAGIAADEWSGGGIEVEAPEVDDASINGISDMASGGEVDLDTLPFFIRWFGISDGLCRYYREAYGSDLVEDMLYFRNQSADREKGIRIVNQYLEVLRKRTVDGEAFLYQMSKKYFGQDSLVLCHPTWWGDELDSAFDVVCNGLDWWEVPKDFAQTDELILLPVRMSRSRRCPETLWYNMWYSMRTMDIRTYYRETWINARYGGRTHYLGYECYEPGVVLCLNQEDYLEKCSEMEEQVARLDEVQTSRPDARILVVFGYEAVSNWKICDPDETQWNRVSRNIHNTWKFTKDLFDRHYLCDLIPSTEIENGCVEIRDHHVCYCGHDYDMLICVMPEGMSDTACQLFRAYAARNENLIIIGNRTNFLAGYGLLNSTELELETVLSVLKKQNILQNCGENFCVYEDGSVLFTTDGEKHLGNPLHVDGIFNGMQIQFDGEDFLYVKREDGGFRTVCGKIKQMTII